MNKKKSTLQESAMRYGTAMGLFWTLKFILFPIGMEMPIFMLLFFFLTMSVPILGFLFARKFRNDDCEGNISFSRAFLFIILMYLFATLFVTIIHYLYFRYWDNGLIVGTYEEMLDQLSVGATGELESSIGQIREALEQISQLTPIEISMQLISQNIFYCTLLAVPTALLVMRKPKTL